MSNIDLINQSYSISCDHITKLNEDYSRYNNTVFNKHFTCLINKNNEDYKYKYNTQVNDKIGATYISKKTCYNADLNEKDNHNWDILFKKLSYDIGNATFNENTRQRTRSYSR